MKTLFLLFAAAFSSFYAAAQNLTFFDSNSSVDKWAPGTEAGVYVLNSSGVVCDNVKAQLTEPETGRFSARVKGVRNGREYKLFTYSPFSPDMKVTDGKMKVNISPVQDGNLPPFNFGTVSFKGGERTPVACDMAARNNSVIIKLSSKCDLFRDWELRSIRLSVEEGHVISGDALLDVATGHLSPDPEGENCSSVTYVPAEKTFVGRDYKEIRLKVLPCGDLHGRRFRLDYTFSKDGREEVVCHDVVGMNLYESYTITLEERIPSIIAGRWHMADYPGENWETAVPETMGYSSAKLEELRKYIRENRTTTSMMVIVGGKVIFSMGDLEEPVRIASCRKSLMSMLYGKYVENGTIDLDATLEELGIDDKGGLLPIEKKATVRNLITARSGVYHPAANDGDDTKHAPERGSVEPGSYYLYNNWDFNCAGGVFEKLTGKDIYDAFKEDIADPVGMQDYYIDNQHKTGITDPTLSDFLAYHFWLSTRDMARVAYLMLHKGNWNGTQVLSEDWVRTISSVYTPRAEMNPASRHKREFDYGYLWWIFCKDFPGYDESVYGGGYTATGSGGQYMTVLPALDMVIAHKDKSERTEKSEYYKLIAKVAACRE